MNILPNEERDFSKPDYWNKFFRQRGSKPFEWYGEYHELSDELLKYIKPSDNILMVGCGNSKLSSDLYDVGYKNITNIDISSVVINHMKKEEGKCRPEMVFEEMDALNMTFEEGKFTVVVDKGTLDALMPLDGKEDNARAQKLFSEVERVIKIGGRYIIISLLQPHILRRILSHFTEIGWIIRIIRCQAIEKKNVADIGDPMLPVFIVICTKLKKLKSSNSILEVNIYINDNMKRITSCEEVLRMIDGVQKAIMLYREAKDEIEIEFFQDGKDKVRFLIHIVDASRNLKVIERYGAFIIPQGRENEWMFGTKEGRKYLLSESGLDRLAVIALRRDQTYDSQTAIQEELSRTVLEFAPCFMNCESYRIPFMTIGDSLGRRETIFRAMSEISGEVVVEEVEIDRDRYRRLIFMENQAVVQSDIKLIHDKKKNKWKIDYNYLPSCHISYMSMALHLVKEPKSALVIGLGGGGLCLFLNKLFPRVIITGVEIDPVIVKIAKDYFGLKENTNLKVITQNGLEVIKKRNNYDVIIFDVDSKEQGSVMSSPPAQFLEESIMKAIEDSIGKTGIFVVNVVCRVETVHKEFIKKLRKYFTLIAWYNMKEDVNRIVFLCNKDISESDWKNSIISAGEYVNRYAKEKLKTKSLIDLIHLETELTV